MLISTPGQRGQVGVQTVTQRRDRGHRPGTRLRIHGLGVGQSINQLVELLDLGRMLGG